ncbi:MULTISPECIES: threonine/serine exporter family protein [Thermoactinomyces]|jgi:uncharacterized membrane protein YjjB (DUF3815 family)|uniref:Threonine/serine exporter family protein n=1 Tax=Thermoactinomyces daqus TaxID=1329516 RepID=A0A7W1XC30_9BACL|nr:MULTISPECIES: threonine/serine exporter family protein [Thermoactinomyces]MBA4543866.1 threonine/serine exporter family protein [Thermoactinomyces daqus]MBH8599394.1 threonine/serine exporter family protein [Thermoactinomyces sp. CICC 10523]MBH8605176.1 threonine/serine exporter family protein [Thermoactinomyces sp. CICC 10522]MBH8608284.1 threonine/serine exporter family protein [Thermoactinomyces sp. CICC 10521]
MIVAFLVSFMASAGFGILFNAPKKALVPGGLIGAIGWVLYMGLSSRNHLAQVFATVVASFAVTAISQCLARIYRMPVLAFNVSGIIPLVPGGIAYHTMRQLVESNYIAAIQSASQTFLISGAIAFGLGLGGTIIPIMINKWWPVAKQK